MGLKNSLAHVKETVRGIADRLAPMADQHNNSGDHDHDHHQSAAAVALKVFTVETEMLLHGSELERTVEAQVLRLDASGAAERIFTAIKAIKQQNCSADLVRVTHSLSTRSPLLNTAQRRANLGELIHQLERVDHVEELFGAIFDELGSRFLGGHTEC